MEDLAGLRGGAMGFNVFSCGGGDFFAAAPRRDPPSMPLPLRAKLFCLSPSPSPPPLSSRAGD